VLNSHLQVRKLKGQVEKIVAQEKAAGRLRADATAETLDKERLRRLHEQRLAQGPGTSILIVFHSSRAYSDSPRHEPPAHDGAH